MIRRLALLLAIVPTLLAGPLHAQQVPLDVIVRTTLKPDTGAVIGQHLRLLVDVLFKDDMPRPPRVSLADVPGAQVFRFETQATTMSESIGGTPYVGQRFEFALYPRRGGALMVPPARVMLLDRAGNQIGTTQGEAAHTDILVPPGVSASAPVVATDTFTMQESWVPAPTSSFRAGDAITRTITRTASDIAALAMRDLVFPAPDGVRVYADPPRSEDRTERGALVGERIDRVTYVFERGGTFDLPAVTQPWWDLTARALKTVTGAGISVSVAPAEAVETDDVGRWWRVWTWLAPAGLLAIAVLLAAAFRPRVISWRDKRRLSEAAAFRALIKTCAGSDAKATYAAFRTWLSRLPADARLRAEPSGEGLERALYGGGTWSTQDSRALSPALKAARAAALDTPRRASSRPPLPPLNPGCTGRFHQP